MKIGKFDTSEKTFIIAELSANHNGSIQVALDTIVAAKAVGADAIKLQTYTPDTITLKSQKDDFKISNGSIWDGQYLHDLYASAFTPWEWHEQLFAKAKELGLECFSSPFDHSAVDFLEKLNPPAYKIASFEITDIPLIKYVASKMRPVIISTGIAEEDDIKLAIETIKAQGNNDIIILKCTSSYPAPLEEANLSMIQKISRDFGVESGLSDHTLGIISPIIAVSMGAKVIEKHFILDRSIGGPDASFSLDQKEFKEMVDAVRDAEKVIGKQKYGLTEKARTGKVFSRSLYFVEDLAAGSTITEKSIRSVRPGHGLHPKHMEEIIGKKVTQDVEPGDRTSWDIIK